MLPAHENSAQLYLSAARRSKSAAPPRLPRDKNSLSTQRMDQSVAPDSSWAAPTRPATAYFLHQHPRVGGARFANHVFRLARYPDRSKIHSGRPRIPCNAEVQKAPVAETPRKRRDPTIDLGGRWIPHREI